MNGTEKTAENNVDALTRQTAALAKSHPGFYVGQAGAVSSTKALNQEFSSQLGKAGMRSLPLPIVFAFVLTFAFLLMLASFRSIVIAAVSLVTNLLSVAAAYGVMVAVFQYGWGERLLDFKPNGGIAPWLPMVMFVILFGLSMDYQVFILSRIREAHDRGLDTKEAVARGIKTTAGTVTSAAVVMVGAFSIFATLPILDMKEMGIGLAAAVFHRRHHRPGRAPARNAAATRRAHLVSAPLAHMAAQTRASTATSTSRRLTHNNPQEVTKRGPDQTGPDPRHEHHQPCSRSGKAASPPRERSPRGSASTR
jgi:MMPL family